MATPFRRKGTANTQPSKIDVDADELMEELETMEPTEPTESDTFTPEIEAIELEDHQHIESLTPEQQQAQLMRSASTVVSTCMDLRRGENILIVCDPSTTDIGQALHKAASSISDRVLLVVMPKGRHHGEEPPAPVANLMRQQQVILAPTRYSLTHTRAVRQAIRDGARVATMPGVTMDMFVHGGMSADFNNIKQSIGDMLATLRRKRIVNVKCASGTNVTFEVNWREWKLDDNGICNRPRMLTNLPAGKIFTMPREGTMNGTIVIDGSWESALVDEPITFQVEDGLVVDVRGGTSAAQIRQAYGEVAKRLKAKEQENVWTVAEFGFGMNPRARLIGNVLEDEKRKGTSYFSIGDNTGLGGTSAVGIHISGVVSKPSVWVDDVMIIEDGVFAIDG